MNNFENKFQYQKIKNLRTMTQTFSFNASFVSNAGYVNDRNGSPQRRTITNTKYRPEILNKLINNMISKL